MTCCGKSGSTAGRPSNIRAGASLPAPNSSPLKAYFRCTGQSAVIAKGGNSGKLYRFPPSGLIVSVDAQDTSSLSRVPHLQAVRPR